MFEFESDSSFGKVDVEDCDFDSVSESERVSRNAHPGDVDQALTLHAHIDEGAEMGHVGYATSQLRRAG